MDQKKPPKEITDLTPKNSDYASRIASARGVQHPVGGAPMPKMPNFAEMQTQDRHAGVQQQRAQGMHSLLTQEQRQQLEQKGQFIPGVGSAFAANQPAAGQVHPTGYQNPPRPPGSGISQETAEQLKAVAQANAPEAPKKDAVAKETPDPDKMKKDIDELEDEIFDYDEFGNRVRSLLANKERCEAIEKRCEPMDLMDLLVNKEVRQQVPVVPGKYEPEFRSTSGEEDLFVKRRLNNIRGSAEYILSNMTLMNLTCGLYAINGRPLPSHIKGEDVDDEAFDIKFKSIKKYPMQVLADLAVNYSWFDKRVRKLLIIDGIKDF